jgi:hypothetical protein
MSEEVFLDAAYAIALSSPNDLFHMQAVRLADELESAGTHLVTTHAVLLEIGNALSKRRFRSAATRLLLALSADSDVEIVPFSEELFSRALELYNDRPDKEWGLTDCMSFVLMTNRGMTRALTTDEHFQQAGFRVLMRESS